MELIQGAVPADRPELARLVRALQVVIPGAVCLGLNLAVINRSSYGDAIYSAVRALSFTLLVVISPLFALSRTMPLRHPCDALVFGLAAYAAIPVLTVSLPFAVIGLCYILLTNTTSQWLTAALFCPALLRGLGPKRLLATLNRATDLEPVFKVVGARAVWRRG